LLALPTENFVIQLAAMSNLLILQDYIKDEQLGQPLWIYKTQRYGGDWYVVLKGQYFSSMADARAEIINLSDIMLRNTPFVKSIGQVKQEISVSVP
jgi:DamX protein